MKCKQAMAIAFLLAITVVSCKFRSALNFNEAMAAKEKDIAPAIQTAEIRIKEFYTAGKFDSVAAIGERMEKLLQQKVDEIEAMKAPAGKEGENFKAACVRAFESVKAVYSMYKRIGKATTAEARQKQLDNVQQIVKNKEEAVEDMQAAQKRFAAENGFKIQ